MLCKGKLEEALGHLNKLLQVIRKPRVTKFKRGNLSKISRYSEALVIIKR